MPLAIKMKIELKKYSNENFNFVKNLYFEFKTEELKLPELESDYQNILLEKQFSAQVNYYKNFGDAFCHYIITADEKEVGRYIILKSKTNWHLADMMLLKEYRKKGIAKFLLTLSIKEAKNKNKSITCYVDKQHTIQSFYKRLGFEIIKDEGMEYLMELK